MGVQRTKNDFIYWDGNTGNQFQSTVEQANYDFDVNAHKKDIATRNYSNAARRMSYYYPNDPKKAEEWFRQMNILENSGYEIESKYSTIQDDDTREAMELADTWKNYTMFQNLNNKEEGNENSRAAKLQESLANFGGTDVSAIGITFKPKKRTFLGVDFLAADNPYTIDNFYQLSGISEDDLWNYGVDVTTNKNGTSTLFFNKNNPLALQILYGLFVTTNSSWYCFDSYTAPTITTFDRNYKELGNSPKFGVKYGTNAFFPLYSQFKNIINQIRDAETISKNWFDNISSETYLMESTVFGNINDQQQEIEERYNKGEIKESEYNSQMNHLTTEFNTIISNMTPTMEMYSAAFNDNGISDLVLLDSKQATEVRNLLANATQNFNSHRFTYGLMESGGKLGMYINVIPKEKQNKGELSFIGNVLGNKSSDKPISVFIPGLFTKDMQEEMISDPIWRSNKILQLMTVNGSDYTLNNGLKIKTTKINDSESVFEYDGKIIDKEKVRNLIYKDKAIQDAQQQFYLGSLGANNEFINADEYAAKALNYTIDVIIPKIYNQYNITRSVGDYNSIDIRGHSYPISDILSGNLQRVPQYEEMEVINEIRDIYKQIMSPAIMRLMLAEQENK